MLESLDADQELPGAGFAAQLQPRLEECLVRSRTRTQRAAGLVLFVQWLLLLSATQLGIVVNGSTHFEFLVLPAMLAISLLGFVAPSWRSCRHLIALGLGYQICAIAALTQLELRPVSLILLFLFRDSTVLLTHLATFIWLALHPAALAPFVQSSSAALTWTPELWCVLAGLAALGALANRLYLGEVRGTVSQQLERIWQLERDSEKSLHHGEQERAQLGRVIEGVGRAGQETRTVVSHLHQLLRAQQRRVSEQAIDTSKLSVMGKFARDNVQRFDNLLTSLSSSSRDVVEKCREGGQQLTALETMLQAISAESELISEGFRGCSAQAAEIAKIGQIIETVIRQTRLLSLNAAIEAEKAGEYGTGFGVLAKEIRRLAQQTESFLHDMDFHLSEIQRAVSAGERGVSSFVDEVLRSRDSTQAMIEQVDRVVLEGEAVEPLYGQVQETLGRQLKSMLEIAQLSEDADHANEELGKRTKEFAIAVSSLERSVSGLSTGALEASA